MNNVTQEKQKQKTTTEVNWKEAESSEVHMVFWKYLSNESYQRSSPQRAKDKLMQLSTKQFRELYTDVYDEYLRRFTAGQGLIQLPLVSALHPKRNLARAKISTFPAIRFRDLLNDAYSELNRRSPAKALELSTLDAATTSIAWIVDARRQILPYLRVDTPVMQSPTSVNLELLQQEIEMREMRKGETISPSLKVGILEKRSIEATTPVGLRTVLANTNRSPAPKIVLPMVLNGKTIQATPDSGSEQNIIAKKVVTELGLSIQVEPQDQFEFRMGNNRVVKAVGRVEITCQFASKLAEENSTNMSCWFYVFQTLITPLIMGMAFLEETETLTKNKHRLEARYVPVRSLLTCASIDNPKRRLQCSTSLSSLGGFTDGGLFTMAVADTGSEVDLVSRDYCERHGLPTTKIGERLEVQFADGSISSLFERIDLEVALGKDIQTVPLIEIVPRHTFYVLDDLICDLLLGETFFHQVEDLLQSYSETFVIEKETSLPGVNTIVWFKAHERMFSWFNTKDDDKKLIASSKSNSANFDLSIDDQDARENRRREQINAMIKRLPPTKQVEARVIEANKKESYERERLRLMQARSGGK